MSSIGSLIRKSFIFLFCCIMPAITFAAAMDAGEEEDDEVFRNRPFISNRATTPPPVEAPPTQPTAVSASSLSDRTLELLDGKKVAFIPVGTGSSHFDKLGKELNELLQSMDWAGGEVAAYVEDGQYVIPILEAGADKPMAPASVQKLMTVTAALKMLGSDYRYLTTIRSTGPIEKNVLKGSLVVVGSGDPTISSRYAAQKQSTLAPLRSIAKEIRNKGIRTIEGHLLADSSAFDSAVTGPGWPDPASANWQVAEVSALTFNDNLIDFLWKPQRKDGSKPPYTLEPMIDTVRVENHVRIDKRPGRDWRLIERRGDSNYFQVSGQIPPRQQPVDSAAVHDPDTFFLDSLRLALKMEGVEVKGASSVMDETAVRDLATSGSTTLLVRRSAPIPEVVLPTIQYDQHLHAELLFKTIGRELEGKGSFQAGISAMETFMSRARLKAPGSRMLDGSGLSRLDRLTPQQLVRAMKVLEAQSGGKELLAQLPRAGMPGLLQNRFIANEEMRQAVGKVQAMPGHAPGTHTLAGTVITANGRRLFFAIMVNGSSLPKSKARENIDRLVLAMTKSPLPADPTKPIPPATAPASLEVSVVE